MIGLAASPLSAPAQVCDGISEAADSPLTTVRIASRLNLPLLVTAPPDDLERIFVLEQDGRIRIIKNGTLLADPFLDITSITRSPADGGGNEEGLLGMAFHPQYETNGHFFLYHTDSTGANNVVERYERSFDPDQADPLSGQVVITFPHPSFRNHNGGMIAFGPNDGFLYIGTGDGGSGCDPFDNSQDVGSPLGKLLRIDVEGLPYAVPPDNPLVGVAGAEEEIWAMGLRNPWRFAFDSLNSDLYIGDVGQGAWEEIDYQEGSSTGGENYGWDLFEGSHCPNPSCGSSTCDLPGHVPPVLEYGHADGACSVTGGHVYRGCRMPGLRGIYFFSDYCAAFIRSFRIVSGQATDQTDRTAELAPGGGLDISEITSFGEDGRGEIYVVDRGEFSASGGELFKIVPILGNLEVSGVGATSFRLEGPSWIWEDLHATSSHPVASYRVYRSSGSGSGTFDCVHQNGLPSWEGGDAESPVSGQLFAYLVTAVNSSGEETGPGTGSGGSPRSLSPVPCPS